MRKPRPWTSSSGENPSTVVPFAIFDCPGHRKFISLIDLTDLVSLQAYQRPVQQLGDSDSLFPCLDDLTVHVKASVAPAAAAALSRMHRASRGSVIGGLASWRSSISCGSTISTSDLFQHRADDGWSATQTTPDSPLPPVCEQASQQQQWEGEAVIPVLHCYHGFGANLFSYKPVVQRLAAAVGGVVSAHDCPGFGLTERYVDFEMCFMSIILRQNRWLAPSRGQSSRYCLHRNIQNCRVRISPGCGFCCVQQVHAELTRSFGLKYADRS